jgi:hypothetical protein
MLEGDKAEEHSPMIPSLSLGLWGFMLFTSEVECRFPVQGLSFTPPTESAASTGRCNELGMVNTGEHNSEELLGTTRDGLFL